MPHPHSLLRLASKIYNTPHLITQDSFNVVLNYLEQRNKDGFKMDVMPMEPDDTEDDCCDECGGEGCQNCKPYANGIGVLKVDGSLTYKPIMTMCGEVGTSYTSLVEQVEEMAEAGVKTIIMEVTSGGGEASHIFECCNDIRAVCDEYEINMIGYADTMACSAAYALISICDEVIANPSASLGSIGCVVALMDMSKAMEKAGLKRIFITSGANKVPFAEDGSFKQEFLDEIQADVDRLNDEFAAHVSTYTGLDVATIKGFEAGVFNADEAVEKGLANKVMTNKQFAAYVAALHSGVMNA